MQKFLTILAIIANIATIASFIFFLDKVYYILYYIIMRFEWDENKNEINKKKHGVSFEDASLVFDDKNVVEIFDSVHSTLEEERYLAIGMVHNVLSVVFTERGEKTRIISARQANKKEKEIYYGNGNV